MAVIVAFCDSFNFSIEKREKWNARASVRKSETISSHPLNEGKRKRFRTKIGTSESAKDSNPTQKSIANILMFDILPALNIKPNNRMTFLKWKNAATEIPFAPQNEISKM